MKKILLVVVLALAACTEETSLPDVPQPIVTGLSEEAASQLSAAYTEAIATPRNPRTAGFYGMLLQAYRLDNEAGPMYVRAKILEPDAHRWHYYHAYLLESRGDLAGALSSYRNAARIDPSYAPGKLRLANLLSQQDQLVEARDIYAAVLKSNPQLLTAAVGLGQTLLALDSKETARRIFDEVVTRQVSNAQAHYELALLARAAGNTAEAAEHLRLFEQYREVQPLSPDRLLSEIGQLNKTDQPSMQRARDSLSRGDVLGAIAHFEEAIRRNPNNVGARVALVALYTTVKNFDASEKHYNAALPLAPDNGKLHFNHGFSLQNRNDHAAAIASFGRALAINPKDANTLAYQGVSQLGLGMRDKALASLQRAVELDPQQREGNARLGQVLLENGDADNAVQYLRRATRRDDRYSITYLILLADALQQLDNQTEATEVRQHASALAQRFGNEHTDVLEDTDR